MGSGLRSRRSRIVSLTRRARDVQLGSDFVVERDPDFPRFAARRYLLSSSAARSARLLSEYRLYIVASRSDRVSPSREAVVVVLGMCFGGYIYSSVVVARPSTNNKLL